MKNPFTEHPHSIGETYLEHCMEALYLFVRLTYSGLAMIIHAFLPFFFTKTASKTIFYFHQRFTQRLAALNKTPENNVENQQDT